MSSADEAPTAILSGVAASATRTPHRHAVGGPQPVGQPLERARPPDHQHQAAATTGQLLGERGADPVGRTDHHRPAHQRLP
jgi:hypothetical protein